MRVSNEITIDEDSKVSIENVNSLDKLDMIERMKSTYTIKEIKIITPYKKENFNVNKGEMIFILDQFIRLEQILTGKTKFKAVEEM